jgi:two-component system LytT family response regulator
VSEVKAYLVDDEQRSSDGLTNLFKTFFTDVNVIGSSTDIATAFTEIKELNPDLVFLDIEMGKQTGFNLLELFDEINFKVVFVTAHEEYALRAIKFSALDYIVKPASIADLKSLFDKFKSLPQKNQTESIKYMFGNFLTNDKSQHKITLPIAEGVEFKKVDDILYIRADGSYSTFALKDKTSLTVSKNLKFFDDILSDYGFYRIHNSTVINLKYIARINKAAGGSVIMEGGVTGIGKDKHRHTGTHNPHLHFEIWSNRWGMGKGNKYRANPGYYVNFRDYDNQSVVEIENQKNIGKKCYSE